MSLNKNKSLYDQVFDETSPTINPSWSSNDILNYFDEKEDKDRRKQLNPDAPDNTTLGGHSFSNPNQPNQIQPPVSKQLTLEDLNTSIEDSSKPFEEEGVANNLMSNLDAFLFKGAEAFVNTATFNTAEWLLDESFDDSEWYQDFESRQKDREDLPGGKIGQSIGNFAGFVYGAPLKIVGRGVTAATMPIAKKIFGKKLATKEASSLSVRQIKKAGKQYASKKGLDKKSINLAQKTYTQIASKQRLNPFESQKLFNKALREESEVLIRTQVATGALNTQQAAVMRGMFDTMIKKGVPIQNMLQLGHTLWGTGRMGRMGAQFLNDAFVYSFVDGAFSISEQYTQSREQGTAFDIDWGLVRQDMFFGLMTGGALSTSAAIFKPLGKMANSRIDFMSGARAWLKSNPYKNLSQKDLAKNLYFFGQHHKRNLERKGVSESNSFTVDIGGEKFDLLMGDGSASIETSEQAIKLLHKKLLKTLGNKNYKKEVQKYLLKNKNEYAVKLMNLARSEGWDSFKEQLPRMVYGGAAFNTGMVAQDYWNTGELFGSFGDGYDGWDIATNFLIGMYTQRSDNPSKWDMNESGDINTIREGIKILGGDPDWKNTNFYIDNNFPIYSSPLEEGAIKTEFKNYLEEEGIVSNDEAVGRDMNEYTLETGEKSVLAAIHSEGKDFKLLQEILSDVSNQFHYKKGLDAISVKEGNKILKKYEEIHGDRSDDVDAYAERKAKAALKATENFEDNMLGIIEKIVNSSSGSKEGELEDLKGFFTTTSDGKFVIPDGIFISKKLRKKIENGEVDFLKIENAENEIGKIERSYSSIVDALSSIDSIKKSTTADINEINDVESLRIIYDSIRRSEENINSNYEMKNITSRDFRFYNLQDYLPSLVANKELKVANQTLEIFSPEFSGRDKLLSALKKVGLINKNGDVIENISQVKFDNIEDIDDLTISKYRRTLGQILSLQSSVNVPKGTTVEKTNFNETSYKNLIKILSQFGMDTNKLDGRYYESLKNIVNSKRFANSRLTGNETNFVLDAVRDGYGSNNLQPEGTSNNFTLSRISVFGNESFANEYNHFISKISEKSGGLVEVSNKTIDVNIIHTPVLKMSMKNALRGINSYKSNVALGTLLEGLTQPGFDIYSDRIKKFITLNPDVHQSIIIDHLYTLGILKNDPKTGDVKIDDTQANIKKHWEDIAENMKMTGYSDEYLNNISAKARENSKPRFLNDSSDVISNPSMSVSEFFKKYRIIKYDQDGNFLEYQDISNDSQKSQLDKFDELSKNFLDITSPNSILRGDAILNLYNNLVATKSITAEDGTKTREPIPLENMGGLKQKMLQDATQVLFGRRNQVEVQVVEATLAGVKFADKPEYHQTNPIYELFFKDLGIEHFYFDNNIKIDAIDPNTGRVSTRIINLTSTKNTNWPKWIQDEVDIVTGKILNKLAASEYLSKENIIKNHEEKDDLQDMPFTPDNRRIGENPLLKLNILEGQDSIIISGESREILEQSLIDFYERNKNLYEEGNDKEIKKILKSIEQNKEDPKLFLQDTDYEFTVRMLVVEKMLKSDSNTKLKEVLNSNDKALVGKTLSRIKLANTKNFIRGDVDYYDSLANARLSVNSNDKAALALKRRIEQKNSQYVIAIWDDETNATIKDYIDSVIEDNKSKYSDLKDWDYSYISDAHGKASQFDSISFVTKEAMMEYHTIMGHDPDSRNAIKPVISSSGEGKALLYGKTLFIHDPKIENYLKRNKLDILLAKSGAKVFDEKFKDGDKSKDDLSLVNATIEDLSTPGVGQTISTDQKRFVDISAIGLKPEKDASITSAKESPADANYHNSEEARFKMIEMQDDITFAINSIKNLSEDRESLRQFMLDELLPYGELPNEDNVSSMQTLSNMWVYLENHKLANPMTFSDNQTKNQIFNTYVNKLINGTRSITNRTTGRFGNEDQSNESNRYGGQSFIIQGSQEFLEIGEGGIIKQRRLLPTLVDKLGNIMLRGEIALADHEKNSKIGDLEGRQVRIVDNNKEFTIEEFLADYAEKSGEKAKELSIPIADQTLGSLHTFLQEANRELKGKTKYQIGIISRRNPRTRPDDITLLGLAGFLDESYGNSTMINSLDIVNIYEGDYDADKVDYFFAHNKYMYDHIKRAGRYFVQGIDPEKFQMPPKHTLLQSPQEQSDNIIEAMGNADSYKKMIGIVQKLPRQINHLEMLSNKNHYFNPEEKNDWSLVSREREDGSIDGPGILFETKSVNGEERVITIDSRSLDFFMRSALEMQYVVDGKNNLNPNIASDIFSWKTDFLFPKIKESRLARDLNHRNKKQIEEDGSIDGERIRIFSRMRKRKRDGKWVEDTKLDLTKAEKEIILTIMDNYNKTILKATGKDSYYGSEKRPMSYNDFMDAGKNFISFYGDIQNKIYNSITSRKVLSSNDYEDLKEIFGTEWVSKKGYGNKWYNKRKLNKNPFRYIESTAENFIKEGPNQEGTFMDQLVVALTRKNYFEDSNELRLLGNTDRLILDEWYNDFISESYGDLTADEHNKIIKKAALSVNKNMGSVVYLTNKINQIKFNKNYDQKFKKYKITNLKKVINGLQEDIQKEIGQRVNVKDVKKFQFVDLMSQEKELTESTIYYNSISEMLKTELIGVYKSDNFYQLLSQGGKEDLKFIKQLRSKVYGDNAIVKDILKHGVKTGAITNQDQKILSQLPNIDDFYKWQTEWIKRKSMKSDHGLEFLLAFMSPSLNRKVIGVHENRYVPLPYVDTKRYRLGQRVLTEMAFPENQGRQEDLLFNEEIKGNTDSAKILYIKLIEAENHYRGYFDKNANNFSAKANNDRQYGMASFDPYIERQLKSYSDFNWTRNISTNRGNLMINNSVLDYYNQIASNMGDLGTGWKIFKDKLENLNKELMSNTYTDPYSFIQKRLELDNIYHKFISQRINEVQLDKGVIPIENDESFRLSNGFKYLEQSAKSEGLKLEVNESSLFAKYNKLSKIERDLNLASDGRLGEKDNNDIKKWNEMTGCVKLK